MHKTISLLGSTGSIGVQALDVARMHGYRVVGLAAGKNIKVLEQQAREFKPLLVAVADSEAAIQLKIALADTDIKVIGGSDAICEVARLECDTVLNAIVGIAGLRPTLAAIEAGHDIALANKETLVAAGSIVMKKAKEANIKILPVDSEHSAIFQSMQGVPQGAVSKILLTASGGPFFNKTKEELKDVTPEKALKHPNWDMGAKITIDSATMMNKGLEVIEAMHLFDVRPDGIEVLVHRESIIHSAIETCDGAVIAQLGTPDMRIPIQYALTYPNRYACPAPKLSLTDIAKLTFYKPDYEAFTCLKACLNAARDGGLRPAAANGANELCVDLFLKGKIGFLDIGELVASAAESTPKTENYTIDDVFEADKKAREYVLKKIK